ncbi:MAG TPA: tetratricopeptide repeat protein [Planctomycetota bacterium]|nr:tetratricopeptide repeat protein [Planctomycetota bacterium]
MSEPKKPSFLGGAQAAKPASSEAPKPAAPSVPTPAPAAGGGPSFFKVASGSGAAPQPPAPAAAQPAAEPQVEAEEPESAPAPAAPATSATAKAPAGSSAMVGIVKPMADFPPGNRAQAEALLVKGLDQYDHEQLDVALAFYQRAIDADLSFSMAHNSLGMVLIDLERYPEAIEAIKNAVRIDIKNTEALSNLGFVYRRVNNDDQAAKAYELYLALEPDDEQGEKIKTWLNGVKEKLGGTLPELDLSLPASAAPAAKPAAKPESKQVAKPAAKPATTQEQALPPNTKPPTKPIPLAPMPAGPGAASIAPAPMPRATQAAKIASPPLPGAQGSGARPGAAAPAKSGGAPIPENMDLHELYEEMLDFFGKEDFGQVRAYAKKILETDPSHLATKLIEGKILTYEHNHQDAVVFFANVLESAPKDPSIYFFLGYCLRALEQDMEAAEAFTKYLELMPTAVDASKTAAWIQKVTGKPMGMRTAAGGVQVPNLTQPVSVVGGGGARGGSAASMLERTYVYIPGEAEVEAQEEVPEKDLKKFQRGVQAFQEGNLEGALKYVDQFLGEHEKFSDAHVLKARILIRNREYDQAITCIQRAIQLSPNSSEAYYYLGQAYEKHGKLQESRACYQRTLELEPEGPRADHLREWLDRAQQAAAVAQEEIVCDRCLRKFEARYVTKYEDKNTCRWCLDLVEAQTGGGLVEQYFPDLYREEQERDKVDTSKAHSTFIVAETGPKSKKGVLIGAAAAVLLLAVGGIWYVKNQNKVVDPIVVPPDPHVIEKHFDKSLFKIALSADKKDLKPDEPFEAAIQIDGAQADVAEVVLELKKDCPEGTHFDADRKKVQWRSPSIIDETQLPKEDNPFTLSVVAVVKEKSSGKVLLQAPATIDLVVHKLDSEVQEAQNYSWAHDEPKQLLPREWLRWKIQGQGVGKLELRAAIVKSPKDAKIDVINGQPVLTWQAPFDGTLEGLKSVKSYDFELTFNVRKAGEAATYFPKNYTFTVTTSWDISADHPVDLQVDPSERVLLGSGQLMQNPGERPDDVVLAHGRPLRDGTLSYLNFASAGETVAVSEAFRVKLHGFPAGVRNLNLFQGAGPREDVVVTDLFHTGIGFVTQGANGLPASTDETFGLDQFPGDMLALDVDHDGKNDLIFTDLHGTQVYLARQNAQGKFTRTADGKLETMACTVDEYAAPAHLVNLKTRGRLALVSGWQQGRVKVQLLEIKWPPAEGQAPITPVGTPSVEIGATDPRWLIDAIRVKTADRDWLAVVTGGEKTSALDLFRPVGDALRRVDPDPAAVSSMVLPAESAAPPVMAVAEDMNRDDLDDLVIGYPHRIDIYWQIAGANSQWLLVHSIKDPNLTGEFVMADVNHDGRLDLVAYDARQKLHVFLTK